MLPFPSHGASGGAASGSISDFSNRTFVESDGSDPSLWDLSSFRKRRCSATSNAFDLLRKFFDLVLQSSKSCSDLR